MVPTIKSIFDEISNEPGSNKKMEILGQYKSVPETEDLKRALYLANSPRVKFYIKQIPAYKQGDKTIHLREAMALLEPLSSRKIAGTTGVNHLAAILSTLKPDDAYIIERIIEKDCKFNMGTTNINKVFAKLIEDTPYMGAKAYDKKLAEKIFVDPSNKGYAYSQVKMDGRYMNAIIEGGKIRLESRGGESTRIERSALAKELTKFPDCVLNGELTIPGIPRYESNGIISSLVDIGKKIADGENVSEDVADFEKKRGSFQKALDSIVFTVWDTITVDEYQATASDTPYHDRLVNLSNILKSTGSKMVQFIKTKKVYSFAEAMEHFQALLKDGQEGTILKASMGKWKDSKPNWQVKLKLEMDVDLKIIGFNYGTGKNASVISSIDAQSSDGLLVTSPTGIKEAEMLRITKNMDKLMGKIVEVKCSGLSHDSDGKYSLLHPVYKGVRDDKNTCDSLDDIKKIEAGAKGLTLTTTK